MITIVTVNQCSFNKGVGQTSVIVFEATGVPDPNNVTATLGGTNASDFTVGSTTQGSPANWYNTVVTAIVALPDSVSVTISITSGGETSSYCIVPVPITPPG